MKIQLIIFAILLFTFPTFAFGGCNNFDWELYEKIQKNMDFENAAKCEAIDLKLYGEPKFDYISDIVAIYIVANNLQVMPVEIELAYYNLRTYHSGRIDGIQDTIDSKKVSKSSLEKAIEKLGCHRNYKKKP